MAYPGKNRMARWAINFQYLFLERCWVRPEFAGFLLLTSYQAPGDRQELRWRKDEIVQGDKLKVRMVL
jgi:hypothetical protein